MDHVDTIVVGAGVIGLAIGRAVAMSGRDVLVLERDGAIGSGTSSRNSEVIHAGLYYEPESLKSKMCVRGKHLLYQYCEERGINHSRCGKLIVAARESDVKKLENIASRGKQNGVHDLKILSGSEAMALETSLQCSAALLSPSSGIVDSHALMTTLLGDAENAGAMLVLNTGFNAANWDAADKKWVVSTLGREAFEMSCSHLINSAGLYAQNVARAIQPLGTKDVPESTFAKGNYFSLASKSPFTRLIYPLPENGGLGIHLTLDLAGQAKFGPDVQWLTSNAPALIDYQVQAERAALFESSVRSYWPEMPINALQPGYSGVRPKLYGPGEVAADFRIDWPEQHGLPGLVNLYGIESPGLTSSLAIGEWVVGIVDGKQQQERHV